MSCWWAGLPPATGYSPKYMNCLLPLDWTSFVLKTMCECSSNIKGVTIQKKLIRNKAVSDGAISFYLDHYVRTRVSKVTYGVFINTRYHSDAPDHRSRSHNVYTSASGIKKIRNSFDIILPKVSFFIHFFKSVLLVKPFTCRIPNFRRQRNSEQLFLGLQILQFISDLVECLFGVTVETSWLQSGKTLIPVRVISELFA